MENRIPIWIALSNLYLDNELQDFEFKYIAAKIKKSPYSMEAVKEINKKEVFPVLYKNLLTAAGTWSGFEEEWLVRKIKKSLDKRTWLNSMVMDIKYRRLKWMYAHYWKKLEEAFQNL